MTRNMEPKNEMEMRDEKGQLVRDAAGNWTEHGARYLFNIDAKTANDPQYWQEINAQAEDEYTHRMYA